jgi:hypothetical protein
LRDVIVAGYYSRAFAAVGTYSFFSVAVVIAAVICGRCSIDVGVFCCCYFFCTCCCYCCRCGIAAAPMFLLLLMLLFNVVNILCCCGCGYNCCGDAVLAFVVVA